MPEHKETPKHFMDGFDMTNDTELVQEVYRRFDENSRLNKSQAARVEFFTTVKYIEHYLTPDAKILDIGAGAGEYSLYFARKGYSVSALELADANIAAFRAKLTTQDDVWYPCTVLELAYRRAADAGHKNPIRKSDQRR